VQLEHSIAIKKIGSKKSHLHRAREVKVQPRQTNKKEGIRVHQRVSLSLIWAFRIDPVQSSFLFSALQKPCLDEANMIMEITKTDCRPVHKIILVIASST
jgi:hypothetical protein